MTDGRHRLLIRPDGFQFTGDGGFQALVVVATFRGDHTLLRVQAGTQTLEIADDRAVGPRVGETVRLAIDPSKVVLLPLT